MTTTSIEADVIAALKRRDCMPPAQLEFLKAYEARHKKALIERLKYRFRTVKGRPGIYPRYPNLSELAPKGAGGFTIRSGPFPPPITCPFYPAIGFLDTYYGDGGFAYGSQETPLVGPRRGDLHLWSIQTAAATGEISLAAHVQPPDFPPQEPGIFFGADGTHVSGTLGHTFYNPDLLATKGKNLRTTARIEAQPMTVLCNAASVTNAGIQYAAGVYGIATITLIQGLNFGLAPLPTSSYFYEFFKQEAPQVLPTWSALENVNIAYLDISVYTPYVPNTTVLTVLVTLDVICAIQQDAVLGDDDSLLAFCDCRFGDKQLAVLKDGGEAAFGGGDWAFRISHACVCWDPF